MNNNVQSRAYPFEMEYSVVGLTCTIIIKMLLVVDQEHLTFFLLLNQLLMIMMIVWIRALFHVWILTV